VNIPLLPLHTVLFPGGVLPLRIFEPRYLDMISTCLRESSPFGVCLIRAGQETGLAASTCEVGTLVRISWFERRPDGLLGIDVDGVQRFRILQSAVQNDQLILANIELLADEPACAMPAEWQSLVSLLQTMLAQLQFPYARLTPRYDDAVWVSARLAELLPLKLELKQALLQTDDPLLRLQKLQAAIEAGDFS